jgi:hypothetical protein
MAGLVYSPRAEKDGIAVMRGAFFSRAYRLCVSSHSQSLLSGGMYFAILKQYIASR